MTPAGVLLLAHTNLNTVDVFMTPQLAALIHDSLNFSCLQMIIFTRTWILELGELGLDNSIREDYKTFSVIAKFRCRIFCLYKYFVLEIL